MNNFEPNDLPNAMSESNELNDFRTGTEGLIDPDVFVCSTWCPQSSLLTLTLLGFTNSVHDFFW